MTPERLAPLARLRDQQGFTMIIAIGVMFVTSLLLVAAFTIANGEVANTRLDATQKQAYYAAVAGVQQYESKLQANPSFWEGCETVTGSLPEEEYKGEKRASERYEVTVLPASKSSYSACSTSKPLESVIQSEGSLNNTFRVESIGYAGKEKKSLIASFGVSGFLDYVYYTNFETEDPGLYNVPSGCAGKYYKEWHAAGAKCGVITFANEDKVEGPMHTNDSANVEGKVSFGRKGHSPPDTVEIDGGTYPEAEGEKCAKTEATFYTSSGCYTTKGAVLVPPESDTSLESYVESEDDFAGLTKLTLNGTANTITVVTYEGEKEKTSTVAWPKNGLIWVHGSCSYTTRSYGTDSSAALKAELGCGTVYVNGTYSKSLTVAGEDDVVIDGNVYPTSVTGKLGEVPTGTAVLGLIAGEYVRVYHPVKTGSGYTNTLNSCNAPNLSASEDPNGWGSLSEPYIYAAILSTSHSFFVDNFDCGSQLGTLHVYGAIAQDYRGIVALVGQTGYVKDYKYDGRLATDEPPYFLAPLKAGWKIIRQTAGGLG